MHTRTVAAAVMLAATALCTLATPTQGVQAVVGEGRAVASAAAPQAMPRATTGWRMRMLTRVNVVRAIAGAPPVAVCSALTTSAQRYASVMASHDFFDHVGPDGRSPWDRIAATGYRSRHAAENIAAGQRTVYDVMQAWRASPGHLAAMTDPNLTHIGFGYAESSNGRYRTYWVQDLGAGGRC